MNPQKLLNQFLGPQADTVAKDKLQSAAGYLSNSSAKAGLAGLAGGGLIGLLVGSKKARKTMGNVAGSIAGYGGAAALGAVALGAYQKWQGERSQAAVADPARNGSPSLSENASTAQIRVPGVTYAAGSSSAPHATRFDASETKAGDGRPFQRALVKALISAANADGHICEEERRAIMAHLSTLGLDADEKSFVFDSLMMPSTVVEIAQLASNTEQAAEIYLVSRMFIDPDEPVERTYLDSLARHLKLPQELVLELETQAIGHEPVAA